MSEVPLYERRGGPERPVDECGERALGAVIDVGVLKAHRLLYHSTVGLRVIKRERVPGDKASFWGAARWKLSRRVCKM